MDLREFQLKMWFLKFVGYVGTLEWSQHALKTEMVEATDSIFA
jgi:hypothetical protein